MSWRKYISKEFVILVFVQYVGFKLSWLLAAYGAVAGPPYSYYGAFAFFGWLGIHVAYYKRVWELWFSLSVGLMGTIIDTAYNATNFIDYNGTYPVLSFLAPIWITSMWIGLAITLDYSLKVLIGKPFWTFFIGAFFGPIAYWSGEGMGAIHFNYPFWPTMAVMSVAWGAAMLGCYWLLDFWRPKGST